MAVPVTLLYASVFALLAFILSFRAGAFRGRTGISILFGEPANVELAERVRAHQNLLEYVPMILIVMAAIEASGGSVLFLHAAGIALLLARLAHAVGLRHDNMAHRGRGIGAAGTALVTLAVAGYGLYLASQILLER